MSVTETLLYPIISLLDFVLGAHTFDLKSYLKTATLPVVLGPYVHSPATKRI